MIPALHHPCPRRLRTFPVAAVFVTGLLLAAAPLASAQSTAAASPTDADKAKPAAEGETVRLEQFVVSGTVAPRRQLESAAAVTTIDADMIKISVPRGGPELMKLVPGVYVESAGGEGRANVYTRGIPQAGGYIFAGLQEDGLGAMAETATRGVAPDMLTRLTGLVARVESVRGGTAGVFMNNAPGGIINFINREGAAVRQGEITVQTSDYNQIKSSLWMSGPLSADTAYAFSADYRKDDGQRPLGFTANFGGSLAANVKHAFANDIGYVKFTGKVQDERNAFYVPLPLKNARDPQTIPGGIDIRHGAIYSADLRRGVSLPSTPDGPLNPDLADGGHAQFGYVGMDLDLKLGGAFRLKDLSRYTKVNWNSAILILAGVATPLQTLANTIGGLAGTQFAAAKSGSNYRYRVSFPGAGNVPIADPTQLNGNGLGILQSDTTADVNISAFQNDLRLTGSTKQGSAVTAGLFTATTKLQAYAHAYTMVTEVHDLPRRLDFEFLDAATGASLGYGTYQGMTQASTAASYRNNTSGMKNFAPYLNAEQSWGNWNFDGGIRHETKEARITTTIPQAYNLNPAGQNNPALRNASFGSGAFFSRDYKLSATVWTVAANYKFNNRLSAYVRYVDAYRMPQNDDFLNAARATVTNPAYNFDANNPTNQIKQLEGGVKFSTQKLAVFASVIDSSLKNQLFTGAIAQADGSLVTTNFFRDTDGVSLELEAYVNPIKRLTLHFVGTQQKQQFANDTFVTGVDGTGKAIAVNIKGNRPVRIPKTFFTASALYKFPEQSWGKLATNVDWEYVGERAGDEANRVSLPDYSQVALGVSLVSGRATYRVQVQNLFDAIGFTEGDPRTALLIGDPNASYPNMRTIGPRSLVGSVTFSF